MGGAARWRGRKVAGGVEGEGGRLEVEVEIEAVVGS